MYPTEALPRVTLGEAYRAVGDSAAARLALEQSLRLTWRGDDPRRESIRRWLAAHGKETQIEPNDERQRHPE